MTDRTSNGPPGRHCGFYRVRQRKLWTIAYVYAEHYGTTVPDEAAAKGLSQFNALLRKMKKDRQAGAPKPEKKDDGYTEDSAIPF